jgi:hypothetical protein
MNRETIAEQAYRRFTRHMEHCRQCRDHDDFCPTGRILESTCAQAEDLAQQGQHQQPGSDWSPIDAKVTFFSGMTVSYETVSGLAHPDFPGIFICWFESSRCWHIVHKPSGLTIAIRGFATADQAIAAVALLRHIDWNRSAADLRRDREAERAVQNIR